MKEKYSCIFILLISCICLMSCKNQDKNILREDEIVSIFKSNGMNCEMTKMQESRSEHFPFGGSIKIIEISGEEIFIFQYNNEKKVQNELSQDFIHEEGLIYYKNNVIFLYRGKNQKIISILTSNLKVT